MLSQAPESTDKEINYSKEFIEYQIGVLEKLKQDTSQEVEGVVRRVSIKSEMGEADSSSAARLLQLKRSCVEELQRWQKNFEMVTSKHVSLGRHGPHLVSHVLVDGILSKMARRPHQLVVEVLEAKGLKQSVLSGSNLTYCLVYVKSSNSQLR